MTADAIVLHGHAYQPPRADPRTGVVPVEPSAYPFRNWNERITAECYRPNAFARIYDDHGRIERIVNNWERMSFDLGPTLARWLEVHEPEVHDRLVAGDRVGRTAIAHPFHHAILPLSPIEDARTELIWGIADFEYRFGRKPLGMWFPETGIDERTLALLPELGITFTVVAPYQVAPAVPAGAIGRWASPAGPIDMVSYDGSVSHDLAFGDLLANTTALVARMAGASSGGVIVAATDAETFGHHHRFTERGVAHALFDVVEQEGLRTGSLEALLETITHRSVVSSVPPSAWSCAHGLGRWQIDCGCSTDGQAGWSQAWRAPLRQALTLLRDDAWATYLRRGGEVFHDAVAARDAFGEVLARPEAWDGFVERHVRPLADESVARKLLESQEATLASFTSCAWFFADVARREVVIVLQEAARSIELLRELGEHPPVDRAVAVLAGAVANNPATPTGREVWEHAMVGDGTLPQDLPADGVVRPFPASSSLAELLLRLVREGLDGSALAAAQAVELIDVTARAGTLLPLDRAQELTWDALQSGLHPVAGPLTEMLGFRRPA